jgi:hypothetical protein
MSGTSRFHFGSGCVWVSGQQVELYDLGSVPSGEGLFSSK